MDGDELSIGQMAKLNCVSEKTLRLYHKKGVLAPVRIDEATGYRFYSLDQCMTVDVVQQMQAIGFSLDEIANILNEDDPDSFEQAVSDRLEKMEEELGASCGPSEWGRGISARSRLSGIVPSAE